MSVATRSILASSAVACALLAAGPARAWNAGTHVYVVDRLVPPVVAADPLQEAEARYGAHVIDLFNNDFTSPGLELGQLLHDPAGSVFMDVWDLAATRAPIHRAFAFGVVSHNNAWGADATAHVVDIATGHGPGWTYAKSEQLMAILEPYLPPEILQLPHDVQIEVGHILIEQSVDLLMLEVDPALGQKVMSSAAARNPSDPALLQVAWSDAFAGLTGGNAASVQLIRAYEEGYREAFVAYGWALSQPNALELVAGQIATMATAFLGVPPDQAAQLEPLIELGILVGEDLCAADFLQEVEGTVAWVGANMAAHGVSY